MINIIDTNPDNIAYAVWKFQGEKHTEINIDGHELYYSQLGETHHGLQCVVRPDNDDYKLMLEKCKQIAQLFREIDELNVLEEEPKLK